ncbi:MAG TPA: hypothetical protein VHO90_20715, partial [Bacteroidales bacterium]|nr:hypothetical protein [Bacteroidales bacterium]
MKKLLIFIIAIIQANFQFIHAQSEVDSLKAKFRTFSKYYVARTLIKDTWKSSLIEFNDACDTIIFQGVSYDSTAFSAAFDRFAKEKSPSDTVVLLLDYGDNISFYKTVQAQELIFN